MPPARADGLDPDAGAYLDRLHLHGPETYGAMASAMGWGATRAWRAEAKLRAAGLVQYSEGKAEPTERGAEMTLRKRLNRLEGNRPPGNQPPGPDMLELDLPPDLHARIDATKAAGTFPHGLSDDDLMTVIHAADVARGRA